MRRPFVLAADRGGKDLAQLLFVETRQILLQARLFFREIFAQRDAQRVDGIDLFLAAHGRRMADDLPHQRVHV